MTHSRFLVAAFPALMTIVAPVAPAYSQPLPDIALPPGQESSTAAADGLGGWWCDLPKESKLIYTDIAAAAVIGVWGVIQWDYDTSGFYTTNEGWFQQDTKYGGADKLGHLWSSYVIADGLTALYKDWGYAPEKANIYAALSAWTVQAAMEVGDMTSETQGFSWEDIVMNTLGVLTSVLMERYPELDRKIDLRVEYVFDEPVEGIFDDYSNQYYSMVLKLDGFDCIENPLLKYLEFHGGYYTRGYGDGDPDNDERSLYAGVSVNFSRLLSQNDWPKTGKVLEYLQPPYTVAKASHSLH